MSSMGSKALFIVVALIIATGILAIIYSVVQLVSGNPAYGVTTVALFSLFGAVIVAFLNGAYFEPLLAREEQERKEEHERKIIEAQKTQLRKALYDEIVIVYCTISTYVDTFKKLAPALTDLPLPSDTIKRLVDFPLYDFTLQNNPLLFWQLPEAQGIATFYKIIAGAVEEASAPDDAEGTMSNYKKAAEVFEETLLRSATRMVDANIDIELLKKCGEAMWKPCIEKLEDKFNNPEKLAEDSRKLIGQRLIPMLERARKSAQLSKK